MYFATDSGRHYLTPPRFREAIALIISVLLEIAVELYIKSTAKKGLDVVGVAVTSLVYWRRIGHCRNPRSMVVFEGDNDKCILVISGWEVETN